HPVARAAHRAAGDPRRGGGAAPRRSHPGALAAARPHPADDRRDAAAPACARRPGAYRAQGLDPDRARGGRAGGSPPMIGRRLLAGAVLAAACVTAVGAVSAAPAGSAGLRSGAFDPPRPAPDFALPTTRGGEFRLSRHLGKVVALTFGYTSCPDVCPTVLAELSQLRLRLGAAAK